MNLFLRISIVLTILAVFGAGVWSVHRTGKPPRGAFLKTTLNATGLYDINYLDQDELAKYTGDEVIDTLYNEIIRLANEGTIDGRFTYGKDLCLALIDKCQEKGKDLLLNLYEESEDINVKKVIFEAFAERVQAHSCSKTQGKSCCPK